MEDYFEKPLRRLFLTIFEVKNIHSLHKKMPSVRQKALKKYLKTKYDITNLSFYPAVGQSQRFLHSNYFFQRLDFVYFLINDRYQSPSFSYQTSRILLTPLCYIIRSLLFYLWGFSKNER